MRINPTTFALALLFAGCSGSGQSDQPGSSSGGSAGGTGGVAGTGTIGGSSGANAAGSGGTSGGTSGAGGSLGGSGGAGVQSGSGGVAGNGGNVSTGGMAGSAGSIAGSGQSGGAGSGTGGASGMAGGGNAGAAGEPFVQPPLVTSAEGAYWVTTGTLTETTSGTADVTVNDTATAQTWEGFGGSFNEKGWDYLLLLSEADRNKALKLLFGRDGCNLTFGRIPMGASDYAMDRYSLNETADDYAMADFSIARDRELLIPFVKAAQGVKDDLRFWASPWSPPSWMKDGPFNDDSPFDGGSMKGDDATLGAHALYFVKFVQAYQAEGIGVELVSPQNEPGYSGTYPTCAWEPATYATFVGQHLAPALAEAGLSTKIMLGTFNGGTGDTSIISTVMGNSTASAEIAVLGYQWGMDGAASTDSERYMLPVWQTEHRCGNYPWETATFNDMVAPNDPAYAVESWGLFKGWIRTGVTAYSIWNMVLDTIGNGIDSERFWPQNALLTVDTTTNTLGITPTYYVFRHFAQFVEPGAVVLGTTGGDAVAFKNPDGTMVAIMYNSGAAKPYVVALGAKKVQFQMPSGAWATVSQSPN